MEKSQFDQGIGYRLNNFAFKPANGTKGGILLLWNDAFIELSDISIKLFSVSATLTVKSSNTSFLLTAVYGPTRNNRKPTFLHELRRLKPSVGQKWLVLGDFNLIYRARDKNNRNLNLRRMRLFRATLNFCELREISLQNRKFTWSNEHRRPTLVKLDRVFCNESWDLSFDSHGLQALATSISDHCPLLLSSLSGPRQTHPFRFENFWTKIPGFHDEVKKAWVTPTHQAHPVQALHIKLAATARHLRS
ncbi:hypothetical protein U9M48_026655 [Paspalum notatum var. saurae]|uniref:Endonuclease/exonuclease/phosphatase domain-containing protein n=1 Tax=Paspalum notatum var. saurae TaxID=547442 RepID=A0AAQ3TVQ1_PASNO